MVVGRQLDDTTWITTSEMWLDWPTHWAARIKPQLDQAVAIGANTVLYGSACVAVTDGSITQAQLNAHMGQFMDYTQTLGLKVLWILWDAFSDPLTATDAATRQVAVDCADFLDQYDNIIAFDAGNEIEAERGATAAYAHAAALTPYLRDVTNIPIGYSIVVHSDAEWTDRLAGFKEHVDIWLMHPYYGGNTTTIPTASADALVNSPDAEGKPWMVSECGYLSTATDATNEAERRVRWEEIGALSARADCLGAIGLPLFDAPDARGYFADDLTTARLSIAEPFSLWPDGY